jgi:carboxyl-terminal processing protease
MAIVGVLKISYQIRYFIPLTTKYLGSLPFIKHYHYRSLHFIYFRGHEKNMDNNKKPVIWLPLLFSITLIVGMMIGYRMRDGMPGKSFFSLDKTKPLQELVDLIKARYVDDVQLNELTDTAINAILGKLDPHSVYIEASDVQESNDDIAGNFFGIGVEYDVIDDTINILHVIADGPSFKAGLQAGDKFLKVNDSAVAGVKVMYDKIRKLLRGRNATAVTIDILRGTETKKISIQRGIIPVSSVDAAYMIEPGIGYIRLNKFSQVTYREFMQSLDKLKGEGLQKLIMDVRGNGGGVLDQAVEVADEFLEGDKLITYTQGSHFPRKEFRCKRPGMFEQGKLVLLCDEGTASASEILAGALQDWDRATIIGRRSFGKGLVQEQYDLGDGSAVRLTVARYYTPLERSIQRPYNKGGKAYYEEIMNRFKDGQVLCMDSVKNDTTKKYSTPSGKIVYGGGGISPDIFVPADTNQCSATYSKIYVNGTTTMFAYQYFMKNRAILSSYKSIQDFSANFSLQPADWAQFENLSQKDSVNIQLISPKEKEELQLRLKAGIARQLWRNDGLYKVLNTKDDMIARALEFLKK